MKLVYKNKGQRFRTLAELEAFLKTPEAAELPHKEVNYIANIITDPLSARGFKVTRVREKRSVDALRAVKPRPNRAR